MYILLTQDSSQTFTELCKSLDSLKLPYSIINKPPVDENLHPSYLENLLTIVKEFSISCIFSLEYSPFLSLACGVLGIKYIAWLIKGYEKDYFHNTLKNQWNYIFSIDSGYVESMKKIGLSNVFYLPLGFYSNQDLNTNSLESQTPFDITLYGSLTSRDSIEKDILGSFSPLKDATKGYIEGCIACQHQHRSLNSIASILPKHCVDDLCLHYPYMQENTLHTLLTFYDYEYFYNYTTAADREIHFQILKSTEVYPLMSIETSLHPSIIHLNITNRYFQTGIPEIAWQIMSSNQFLLSNAQKDFSLFKHCIPTTFFNSFDLLSKSAYFYHHNKEREELTLEIYNYIQSEHTFSHRIISILERIT